MVEKDNDSVDAFLFAENAELLDFRCFRGDRADVSPEDIKREVHSAFVQKKMKRATVSSEPPVPPNVAVQNVKDFVRELATPC
jgi:hypothetical protein